MFLNQQFKADNNFSVLMISLDRALSSKKGTGDSVVRHKQYANFLKSLDIIVFTPHRNKACKDFFLSEKLKIYPTCSYSKLTFIIDAYQIAKKIIKEKKINLITAQDPFLTGLAGFLLKKNYQIPLEIQIHGDFFSKYFKKEKIYNYFLYYFMRYLLPRVDKIRTVSKNIAEKMINFSIPEGRIAVIPVPVNSDIFTKKNRRDVSIELPPGKNILYVGRLVKVKNIPFLFKIMKVVSQYIPSVNLILIGEGPERKRLEKLQKRMKLKNVFFLGKIRYNLLPQYYSLTEFLVLPSFSEGFGRVMIEAALCKKPIVATKNSGSQSIIINGKTGFLIEQEDEENFAKRIILLLSNQKLKKKMGEFAYYHVQKKFDYQKTVKNIIINWKSIIQNESINSNPKN